MMRHIDFNSSTGTRSDPASSCALITSHHPSESPTQILLIQHMSLAKRPVVSTGVCNPDARHNLNSAIHHPVGYVMNPFDDTPSAT